MTGFYMKCNTRLKRVTDKKTFTNYKNRYEEIFATSTFNYCSASSLINDKMSNNFAIINNSILKVN